MQLKSRLISVTAVAAMAAALFYGSTRKPAVEERDAGLFQKKETIYFWYSDQAMSNYVESAAVAFGEREDARVIPVLVSDSEYLEAINRASLTDQSKEQPPDAYLISHEALEKAYLAGLAAQIKDQAGICSEENFPKAALSAVTYQGKLAAYPLFFETSALLYNETYLAEWAAQSAREELSGAGEEDGEEEGEGMQEPAGGEPDEAALSQLTQDYFLRAVPGTVEDILNVANTFDLPEGMEGVMKWDVSDIFYNYWFAGNYMILGGEAGDDERAVDIANQETIRCLEVYKVLNQFFAIESDTVTYDSVLQDFIEGKVVYTIATTDAVARLAQAKEQGLLTFDYGFAPLPDVSAGLKSRSMSVTGAVAVNGYSSHRELAERFAAFLALEYAQSLYERSGKAAASLFADKDNGALQVFQAEYADSMPLPKMMETGNYWLYLERLFARVWNGEDVTALTQELARQISFQLEAGADAG